MKLFSSANTGRVGLALGVVALVASVSSSAAGLPGKNSVDSGDIKNNSVTVQDLKIAFVRVTGTGGIIQGKGIKGIDTPVPNVICLDLAFVPKTGNATRAADSGDTTIAQIGLPPLAAQVGCQAPFTDALVQVPGQPDLNGTYAQFFG